MSFKINNIHTHGIDANIINGIEKSINNIDLGNNSLTLSKDNGLRESIDFMDKSYERMQASIFKNY